MKNNYCLYSTIFPKSKKYFFDFIKSVNQQTEINFKLVLCLNGTSLNKKQLSAIKVPYSLVKCDLPMNKARVYALKKILNFFSHIVLLDSDDYMSLDRIDLVKKNIKKNDFLVNNLYIFSNLKKKPKQWLNIRNNKKINLKDIKNQNFIGLSNFSVSTKALKKIINKIDYNLVALDWCIAKLLLIYGYKGIYKKQIKTFYRQHDDNVSNLKNFSKKQIINEYKNKIENFQYFQKFGIHTTKEIEVLKSNYLKLKNQKKKYISKFIKNKKKTSWWSHI